jgi:hypothetical protein
MDIQGKTVLVLGAWGLVGSAISRKFMEERPKRIIVSSLTKQEAFEAVGELRKEFPSAGRDFFIPWWGNVFVRETLKDLPRSTIIGNSRYRRMLIEDMIEDLTDTILKRSSLYRLMQRYKPEVVVDCINSATAIAYQDVFQVSRQTVEAVSRMREGRRASSAARLRNLLESTERLLCTLDTPQLIRHVQLMYRSMHASDTKIYVKIGTSGTGGMGLNIPYTHSEERPSRVLLSKSAIAGAHTLLLFLMARTPDAPITKEIKPAAAIAWKRIDFGEVRKRGRPIHLYDCPPERAVQLKARLSLEMDGAAHPTGQTLRSVFIDTGENGYFSRGEFETISTPGQMEFVTPEEIAEKTVFEIRAGNTGHDVINALDNATLAPTYRAGYMCTTALTKMTNLEREHKVDSVAFEMLGPPRLSKLLYEAYLLKLGFPDMYTVARTPERVLAEVTRRIVSENAQLRAQIISIGIPILLTDGKSLLRGNTIKIPPFRGKPVVRLTKKNIDRWAHDGWVDLRIANMKVWRERFQSIISMVENLSEDETSSQTMYDRQYWRQLTGIDPGKICGWIFSYEEHGRRMKA